MIELKIRTRRDTALCGRCFKALFGIPFGPGALPNLRPLMASWTSSGLVNLGSLTGAMKRRQVIAAVLVVSSDHGLLVLGTKRYKTGILREFLG
jgi:hypothetical protein